MKPAKDVKFTRLKQECGQLMTQGAWVFNTEAEWDCRGALFEAKGELAVTPWPVAPECDWDKESLILVSGGECRSGPCKVTLKTIMQDNSKAALQVELQGPGNLQVMTYPWEIVSIREKAIRTVDLTFSEVGPPES